jgi:aspartate-semialdehyde dehydrogenase
MKKLARGACTGDCPKQSRQSSLKLPAPPLDCDFVFSSLPTDVAKEAEEHFARAGFSGDHNSSPHRMGADVPLMIPEVNPITSL